MPRVKRYEEAVPVLEAELLEAIERDRMAARALDLEAAQRIQDIRRQAAATQGFDAETAAAGARKAIAETRAEFAGRATSPRMRAMLEDVLERRAALVDDELTAHVEHARAAALIDAALQRRQLARRDAVDAITPHAFDIHHQTMLDAIDEHGRLVGLDPAEIAADRIRASSAVHADRTASRIEAGDVEGAIVARDAGRAALTGSDLVRLDALLAEPIARGASSSRVDRLLGARTRDGDTPFNYADPLHGAGGTPTVDYDGGVLAIPAAEGAPVYPTAPGTATRDGDGALVVTHADGSRTRYAGLGDIRLSDGEQVTPDTLLGTLAGGATPQLRYGILRDGAAIDPAQLAAGAFRTGAAPEREALLHAIAVQAGESYSLSDRLRDEAELVRRLEALGFGQGFGAGGIEQDKVTAPVPKTAPVPPTVEAAPQDELVVKGQRQPFLPSNGQVDPSRKIPNQLDGVLLRQSDFIKAAPTLMAGLKVDPNDGGIKDEKEYQAVRKDAVSRKAKANVDVAGDPQAIAFVKAIAPALSLAKTGEKGALEKYLMVEWDDSAAEYVITGIKIIPKAGAKAGLPLPRLPASVAAWKAGKPPRAFLVHSHWVGSYQDKDAAGQTVTVYSAASPGEGDGFASKVRLIPNFIVEDRSSKPKIFQVTLKAGVPDSKTGKPTDPEVQTWRYHDDGRVERKIYADMPK